MYCFSHKCLIQGGHFSGIYRKVQLKPLKWIKVAKSSGEGEEEKPVEALMVLKYGGVLTHAGRKQVLTYFHKDLGLSLYFIIYLVSFSIVLLLSFIFRLKNLVDISVTICIQVRIIVFSQLNL